MNKKFSVITEERLKIHLEKYYSCRLPSASTIIRKYKHLVDRGIALSSNTEYVAQEIMQLEGKIL